ncbi:MAG: hypothetical protein DHS20C12_11890 [Pseudohongiella sp.]|nr:MAG: hypothetical protein DHS20C12_11890 [Pseudohongiella sp.]
MNNTEKRRAFNKELNAQRKRLARIRQGTLDDVVKELEFALARVTNILRRSPTDYQAWLLPQLEAEIRAVLNAVGAAAGDVVGQSIADSWDLGIQFIDSPLKSAGISVAAVLPAVDARQLVNLRHFGTSKIKDITAEIASKINTQLVLAVTGAQPVHDSIQVITHLFEVSDKERALRVVRTELGRAFSTSTQQRLAQAAELLPGMKKQWRKSGKLHARPTHVAANDQIQDVDEPFSVGGVLMMHPHDPAAPAAEVINCGCTALPYMESWELS